MGIIGVALARNADNAKRILIPFGCDVTVAVGDFVYQDSATDEWVKTATNNTLVSQVIGVVYAKPQAQIASVLILGIAEGFSGLITGSRVFLSPTGTPTNTRPTSGFVHNLGVAVSETDFLLIPNNIRVKLT
jgi:hypothetical protein